MAIAPRRAEHAPTDMHMLRGERDGHGLQWQRHFFGFAPPAPATITARNTDPYEVRQRASSVARAHGCRER